jgi:hypothetical protein
MIYFWSRPAQTCTVRGRFQRHHGGPQQPHYMAYTLKIFLVSSNEIRDGRSCTGAKGCHISEAHQAFYPMGTGGSFPGGTADVAWSWPRTSNYAEVKNTWIYTSTPPYVFMARWLINQAQGQLRVFGPLANYADRATAACWRRLKTGGIRCADHATPYIRKSWHYFANKRRSA